jgi:FkbM family methyltransferase
MINKTEYLRFRWSHDHALHRSLVLVFNNLMRAVPFRMKYALGLSFRRNRPPYNLIGPGSVVVQVGAPMDTLLAGRSRAAYFCLLAGRRGKVVIVEPDLPSIRCFRAVAREQVLTNAIFASCAAWSEPAELNIHFNPRHPAANFVDGTKQLTGRRLSEFRQASVPADTLDSILQANNIASLDLASLTTNGSEREILKGMLETISRGVTYIALARTGDYSGLMKALGYELHSHDDRGLTFRQTVRLGLDELRKVL